jgi:hypothetical protein
MFMDDLFKLRELLEKKQDLFEFFDGLVTAAILLGYTVSAKEIGHKKYIYFATTFMNKKKEIHLDFSFNKSGELISICTCSGDCNSASFGDKYEKFNSTIDCFKNLLLS